MNKKVIIAGSTISLVFIILLLWNIDGTAIIKTISEINYYLIVPAVIIQLMSYWVRGVRWHHMLINISETKVTNLFPIICISYMANNVLPFRVGELVRAYLLDKKEKISKTSALSSILLERIFDGLTLLLILGIAALLFPFPIWVKQIGLITLVTFLCVLLFLISLLFFDIQTIAIVRKVTQKLSPSTRRKIDMIIVNFLEGIEVVKKPGKLVRIIGLSVMVWCMEGILFIAIAEAFDFNSIVYLAMFTMVLVNLGIMIPSSPGYIGTFEFFCVRALSVFNITKEIALSYALILRVFQYIPITILGYYFLIREGITLSKMASNANNLRRESDE